MPQAVRHEQGMTCFYLVGQKSGRWTGTRVRTGYRSQPAPNPLRSRASRRRRVQQVVAVFTMICFSFAAGVLLTIAIMKGCGAIQ